MSDEKLNVTINADSDELKKSLDEAASKLSRSSKVSQELANSSQKVAKSMDKEADAAAILAKETNNAADAGKNLAEATENASESSSKAKESVNGLKVSLTDFAIPLGKTGMVLKGTWKGVVEAITFLNGTLDKMMGQMAKVGQEAQKMGVSAESFQALKIAADDAKVDFETFASSFDKVRQAISQASAGNEEMAMSFAELGLRYEELMSLSPEDQFFAVTEALSELEDEGERNRLGTALLGDEYVKIAGRLEEFSATATKAKSNAAIISDKDIETAQRYQQSMDKLSSTLEKISMTVLGPVIRDFSESMDEMYNMMRRYGAWESIKELTGFGSVMEDAAKPISQDEMARARRNIQQRKVVEQQKEERREERAQVREEAKRAIEAKREEPARQDAARQAQREEAERLRKAEMEERERQRAAERAARDEQTRQRNLFDAKRALSQAEMRLADIKARHKAEAERRETNAQLAELDRRQKALRKSMSEDTVPKTARERRLRRRNLQLDRSIAQKQALEMAGERVTYTPRERKRMKERERAEKKIADLEAKKEKIRQQGERREERQARRERKRQQGEAERSVDEAKARIRDLEAKAPPQSDGVASSGMKASKSTSFAPSPLAKGAAGASAAATGPSAIGQQLSAIQAILMQMSTKFYFVQG